MATISYYPGRPDIAGEYSDPEARKNRAKEKANAELIVLKRDFLNDLPEYLREILERTRYHWQEEPWFEEAWNKYRTHVIESTNAGKIPQGPGVIFNDYINAAIDEDFLEAEQKSILHSDLSVKEIGDIVYNEIIYMEPIIMHDGLSKGKQHLCKGHASIIDLLVSKKCGNITVDATENKNQNE